MVGKLDQATLQGLPAHVLPSQEGVLPRALEQRGAGLRSAGAEEMAGDAKRRKVSGATAPFTAVAVDSFSPCWGEAEDVWTSLPVFLAAVNRWLLALVAADILTMAVGIAYVDILLRIADGGRQRAV